MKFDSIRSIFSERGISKQAQEVTAYQKEHPEVIQLIDEMVSKLYGPLLYLSLKSGLKHILESLPADQEGDIELIVPLRDGAAFQRLVPNAIAMPLSRSSVNHSSDPEYTQLLAEYIESQIPNATEKTLIFIDSSSTAVIPASLQYSEIIAQDRSKVFLLNPISRHVESSAGRGGWVTRVGIANYLPPALLKILERVDLLGVLECGLQEPLPELEKFQKNGEKIQIVYSGKRHPVDIALNTIALDSLERWRDSEGKTELDSLLRVGDFEAIEKQLSAAYINFADTIFQSENNPLSDSFEDRPKEKRDIYWGK